MQNLGIVKPGSKLRLNFDTFDGGTGAPITMTGFTTADIEIYKDDEFVTQRASDSGYALLDDGIDVDGITGVHAYSVDLADNSTAGFYACGSHYSIRVGPVTIDGQTVNFWHVEFTIGQPDAVLNTTIASITDQDTFVITDGPAEADALNGCVVMIQDVASAVQFGFAVVTDYAVTTKTVQLLAGPTYTLAATDSISFFPPVNNFWFGQAAQAGDGSNLTETGGDGAQLTEAGGDGDHLTEAGGDGDHLTATQLGTDAVDADAIKADGATEIGNAVWDTDATGRQGAGSFGQAIGDPGANAETMYEAVVEDAAGANIAADIIVIEGQTDDIGVAGAGLSDLGGMSSGMQGEVNAEVVDVLKTDVLTATPQQAPPTTPTFEEAIMVLYDALVHGVDVTATLKAFKNNGGTVIWKKALSDDATIYAEAESASGPA